MRSRKVHSKLNRKNLKLSIFVIISIETNASIFELTYLSI